MDNATLFDKHDINYRGTSAQDGKHIFQQVLYNPFEIPTFKVSSDIDRDTAIQQAIEYFTDRERI